MARKTGAAALILIGGMAAEAVAQSTIPPSSPLESGRAALAGHDPTSAITYFSQVDSPEGREWLAVALMMESRSPSDAYVERAYEAARRSRVAPPEPTESRAAIAQSLQPGDMVIAFMVGAAHAYGWAFDRDAFVGYPLPSPAEIAAAVERAGAYIARQDRDGLTRITVDFIPALLGPATQRLPAVTRLILVADGPLRQLPFADLNIDGVDEIQTADFASLSQVIARPRSAPGGRLPIVPVAIGVVVTILLVAGGVALRRS
jgi:hypothetical protein